ncbi:MAG: 1,4-alpha-glucan branching protein GlgB [Negativicutes bacterium]|nr:1,4-alpha-glucan branching protein GlgB [Negativicutes bacterium]MDR3590734.1 1,4-alpha-glucan branching protein GlgB [Negativicutes bacterium]
MQTLELTSYDLYLFNEGTHCRSYEMLGAHITAEDGSPGVRFAVWAPSAREVRVVGNFNSWQGAGHVMRPVGSSGIWSLFIPDLGEGEIYKYEIYPQEGWSFLKADPFAFWAEESPATASRVACLDNYHWQDGTWQKGKNADALYKQPINIYEVHLGSWRHKEGGRSLTYRELADELVEYVVTMGYSHIELLPVVEHPFGGSWGYQATGYFAVTSRYGSPHDFMYFVDKCHQSGIGVILDWVPGHFCKDSHGLYRFDGTPLFESGWPERGENWQWGTANFDFGRSEIQSFLVSNALFWLDVYHIDGLRVDAVANILYLDYGRHGGDWIPNSYGGNGNIDAMNFLKKLNSAVFREYPATMMIAEESTAWPMVTWPTHVGGLGFNFKWNMGWMNDMLRYMSMDPVYRKWWHNLVTFSFMYAFSENFILPLSHDEVVHGKRSLLDKMPGDYWQKFANLRLLYGYMMAHPGKKTLFMGGEFGHFIEWNYEQSLDWHLLDYDLHHRLHQYVQNLNHLYRDETSLWQIDYDWQGFEWIDPHDFNQSVITFMRKSTAAEDFIVVVCNFTPEVRYDYRIGVPKPGSYQEIFNSDREMYGGSGQTNSGLLVAEATGWHNQPCSLQLKLPPLAVTYLKWRHHERPAQSLKPR